jgi:hypothetical protein
LRAGADQSALVGFKVECRRHTGRWIFDESSLLSPEVSTGFYRRLGSVAACWRDENNLREKRIDFSDFRFVTTMLDRRGVLRGGASR